MEVKKNLTFWVQGYIKDVKVWCIAPYFLSKSVWPWCAIVPMLQGVANHMPPLHLGKSYNKMKYYLVFCVNFHLINARVDIITSEARGRY